MIRLVRRQLLAGAVLAALLWAAPAQAGTTKAIWGPHDAGAFNRYAELGVGVYQTQLSWRTTENQNNVYTWPSHIQQAITNASARGMKVAVLVKDTPPWANGNKPRHVAPTSVAQ